MWQSSPAVTIHQGGPTELLPRPRQRQNSSKASSMRAFGISLKALLPQPFKRTKLVRNFSRDGRNFTLARQHPQHRFQPPQQPQHLQQIVAFKQATGLVGLCGFRSALRVLVAVHCLGFPHPQHHQFLSGHLLGMWVCGSVCVCMYVCMQSKKQGAGVGEGEGRPP